MTCKIEEMSWTAFDERRKMTDTVIIPTGAVEIYGPHLPMGSDTIVAEALALRIAEKTGALVAPAIGMGDSSMLLDYPGTLTLRKSTYEAAMDDLCTALMDYGFKNLMFINGHAGNVDMVNYLARRYQRERKVKCGQIDWWRFAAESSTLRDIWHMAMPANAVLLSCSTCDRILWICPRPRGLSLLSNSTKTSPT